MRDPSKANSNATPIRTGETGAGTPPPKLVAGDPPRQPFGDTFDQDSGGNHPSNLNEPHHPARPPYGDSPDDTDSGE